MNRTWTTAEVVRRERVNGVPTRTLWRLTTWHGGVKGEQREEWREPSEDDEPTGLESRGG